MMALVATWVLILIVGKVAHAFRVDTKKYLRHRGHHLEPAVQRPCMPNWRRQKVTVKSQARYAVSSNMCV